MESPEKQPPNSQQTITISGVVSRHGAAQVGTGDTLTVVFWFRAWRSVDGPVQFSKLTFRKDVSEAELFEMMARVRSNQILQVRARLHDHRSEEQPSAELVEIIGPVRDESLEMAASQLDKGVTFNDEHLGDLVSDDDYLRFEGEVDWNGQQITLLLDAASIRPYPLALSTARQLFANQADWNRRIVELVIADLLPLKNGGWLEEGEAAVTREEFLSQTSLESIHVTSEGTFEFAYDADDLFWGHYIVVSGNLENGPTDAGIEG